MSKPKLPKSQDDFFNDSDKHRHIMEGGLETLEEITIEMKQNDVRKLAKEMANHFSLQTEKILFGDIEVELIEPVDPLPPMYYVCSYGASIEHPVLVNKKDADYLHKMGVTVYNRAEYIRLLKKETE